MANEIKKTRKQTAKMKMVSHHLRLPEPMDDWLATYALSNNYSSEMDAVRAVLRKEQRQSQKQTVTA